MVTHNNLRMKEHAECILLLDIFNIFYEHTVSTVMYLQSSSGAYYSPDNENLSK